MRRERERDWKLEVVSISVIGGKKKRETNMRRGRDNIKNFFRHHLD